MQSEGARQVQQEERASNGSSANIPKRKAQAEKKSNDWNSRNEDAKKVRLEATKQQPQKRKPKREHEGADEEARPPKSPTVADKQRQQIQIANECNNSEVQKYKDTSIQIDRNQLGEEHGKDTQVPHSKPLEDVGKKRKGAPIIIAEKSNPASSHVEHPKRTRPLEVFHIGGDSDAEEADTHVEDIGQLPGENEQLEPHDA